MKRRLLIVLFGTVSFTGIPYQLTPKVNRAAVTVRTSWPGATPYEIERDIIEEQEKALKGLVGLEEMESTSSDGSGSISLRFKMGEDMDDALLRVVVLRHLRRAGCRCRTCPNS